MVRGRIEVTIRGRRGWYGEGQGLRVNLRGDGEADLTRVLGRVEARQALAAHSVLIRL